jgi:predicted dehydrogenase
VVVPSSLHKEYALKAVEKDCHILVEKPIALNLEDADAIIAACEARGVTLCVGHVERYNPAVLTLADILDPADIIALDFQRLSPYDPRISDADIVHDLMIHDVDILNWLVPLPIERLQSQGARIHSDALDYAQAFIEFEGGIVASLTGSRVTETKVRTARITCRDKVVTIDYINRNVEVSRLTQYRQDAGRTTQYRQENTIERVMVPEKEPLLAEFEEFARSIVNDTEPRTSGRDARTALAICDSITASATTE